MARSVAGPHLKVLAVKNLRQALEDLVQIGGKPGPAAKGPPAGPAGHSVPTDWQQSPWS